MSNKDFKRINLWVSSDLYNQIKKRAEDSYLRVGTFTRQLIEQVVKNNFINNQQNGKYCR